MRGDARRDDRPPSPWPDYVPLALSTPPHQTHTQNGSIPRSLSSTKFTTCLLAAAAAAPPPTLPRSELDFISTNNRCILGSESLSLPFPRCTNSGGRVPMFTRQLVTYATRLRSVCVAEPRFTYSLPLSVHHQQFAYSRSIERRGH